MIKHFFCLFILILLSVGLGSLMQNDPGYVLIAFQGWQLQTTLVMFVLILVFSILALKYILSIVLLPGQIQHYLTKRYSEKQLTQINQSILHFLCENWRKVTHKTHADVGHWGHYLLAAQASQETNNDSARNRYLQLALDAAPAAFPEIILFQAKLQIEALQFEQAQASLNLIAQHRSLIWHHLQTKIDLHFENYHALVQRLQSEQKSLKNQTWYLSALAKALVKTLNADNAWAWFKSLPKELRSELEILSAFYPWLSTNAQFQIYLDRLIAHPNPSIEILYFVSNLDPKAEWIAKLEDISPQTPMLMLCLGKWYAKQKLWGKALAYLKASQSKAALVELAQLYLNLEQSANAMQAMEKALKMEQQA